MDAATHSRYTWPLCTPTIYTAIVHSAHSPDVSRLRTTASGKDEYAHDDKVNEAMECEDGFDSMLRKAQNEMDECMDMSDHERMTCIDLAVSGDSSVFDQDLTEAFSAMV